MTKVNLPHQLKTVERKRHYQIDKGPAGSLCSALLRMGVAQVFTWSKYFFQFKRDSVKNS